MPALRHSASLMRSTRSPTQPKATVAGLDELDASLARARERTARGGQEALTNTRKHAGAGATARVTVRWLPGALELEIEDDSLGVGGDGPALVRGGFRMILDAQSDIEVVGEAQDAGSGVERALELHPDLVLMDVRMPGLDGLEATRRLLAAGSSSRILVLTTFDLDEYVYEATRCWRRRSPAARRAGARRGHRQDPRGPGAREARAA